MRPGALLLTPGASADRNQPSLIAIEKAAAPLPVVRIDLPKSSRADRAIAVIRNEAAAAVESRGLRPKALALGGRSFGGRMCSMAVADGLAAAALVLISYPLHPPGRPEQLRIEHFPALKVPCLFISGTRDMFASQDELEAHTAAIPGRVTHVWIEGGDHGLGRKDEEVAEAVTSWLRKLR